jgi:hypothetical protein
VKAGILVLTPTAAGTLEVLTPIGSNTAAFSNCSGSEFVPACHNSAARGVLDNLEDPYGLYGCHTILNCAKACPKNLNPGEAIAAIRRLLIQRRFRVIGLMTKIG